MPNAASAASGVFQKLLGLNGVTPPVPRATPVGSDVVVGRGGLVDVGCGSTSVPIRS